MASFDARRRMAGGARPAGHAGKSLRTRCVAMVGQGSHAQNQLRLRSSLVQPFAWFVFDRRMQAYTRFRHWYSKAVKAIPANMARLPGSGTLATRKPM